MGTEQIAASMERVASVLRRKPQAGLSDDSVASARWEGGLRASVHSDAGHAVQTDMPAEIGGEAGAVTPGWLLRAGLASCAVTRIAMAAAAAGITLQTLEARASSQSDARGLLGIAEPDGSTVPAGPLTMALHVRIAASGVAAERLRALVASTTGCSPVTCAVEQPLPVALHIDVLS
ncbi:OsmC family protein [Paucibacter sediminis]|uniref:OsmC family protein n=1 Tax=Paucibacter sediminis TaxID=3019553 RepID=A0AA95SRP2_9BURK|nr:OsmC family protein [Paucibacter sp. S2-9]WIT13461.1 OsmC family protein [Paucibacter sp. S2-9]